MARTSDAQRASISPFIPGTRAPPPPALDPAEAARWVEIMASVPQGWIKPETYAVLVNYIRHCLQADDLASDIAELRAQLDAPPQPMPEGLTDRQRARIERERGRDIAATRHAYLQTCRAHGYQTQRMASLGSKLRLTTSSQLRAEKARDDRRDSGSSPVKPCLDYGSGRREQ